MHESYRKWHKLSTKLRWSLAWSLPWSLRWSIRLANHICDHTHRLWSKQLADPVENTAALALDLLTDLEHRRHKYRLEPLLKTFVDGCQIRLCITVFMGIRSFSGEVDGGTPQASRISVLYIKSNRTLVNL